MEWTEADEDKVVGRGAGRGGGVDGDHVVGRGVERHPLRRPVGRLLLIRGPAIGGCLRLGEGEHGG